MSTLIRIPMIDPHYVDGDMGIDKYGTEVPKESGLSIEEVVLWAAILGIL